MMKEDPSETGNRLRMLEFFSGIGGMRAALDQALIHDQRQRRTSKDTKNNHGNDNAEEAEEQQVLTTIDVECQAYEINREANHVYEQNFDNITSPSRRHVVTTKLVEQLTVKHVSHFDIWTMSPPCQPFTKTRFAKQQDLDDKRTQGFLAVLKLLEQSKTNNAAPRFLFLENVQGFAHSQARDVLLETLQKCSYSWKEYVVSPIQLGIPNHRKRYYILCEASDRFSPLSSLDETRIHHSFDRHAAEAFDFVTVPRDGEDGDSYPSRTISEYLDDSDSVDWDVYGLDAETLSQPWASDLPLVGPSDSHSHCFTAFYSRQIHKSTGSLLLLDESIPSVATALAINTLDRSDMTQFVGKIRKFMPSELLRLFGFPTHFSLDESGLRLQTQYKLIGNSINVTVVSILLFELVVLSDDRTD